MKCCVCLISLVLCLNAWSQESMVFLEGSLGVEYDQPFGPFDGSFQIEGEIDTTDFLPTFDQGVGGFLGETDSTGSQMLLAIGARSRFMETDTTYDAFGLLYRAEGLIEEGPVDGVTTLVQFFFLYGLDSLVLPTELPDSLDIEEIFGALVAEQKLVGAATSMNINTLDAESLNFSFTGTALDIDSGNPLLFVNFSNGSFELTGFEVTGIADGTTTRRPAGLELSAHPNPFNPATRFSWTQQVPGIVQLDVYNLIGNNVYRWVGPLSAGIHEHRWNAAGVSSGVYLLRLKAGEQSAFKKLMLMR